MLDVWKTSAFSAIYQTQDGVKLLREEAPSDPENHYVGNLESFDDLNETAKSQVSKFYEKQGKLYDLQVELERAWSAYQANPTTFSCFWVIQNSFPVASSERVFYVRTDLSQTFSGNIAQQISLCAAFDRESGASIPLADLFLCAKDDIGKNLLHLAEKSITTPVKEEMEAAFQIEFISFSEDALCLEYPQGTLPSQEYAYRVSIKFTEDCKALLHPWAIPYHSPNHF